MRATLLAVLAAALLLAAGASLGFADAGPRPVPVAHADAGPRPLSAARAVTAHELAGTRCEACHTAASWTDVTFDHGRTGFPLIGRHLGIQCSTCHVSQDFKAPIATSCNGCHRDVHEGELGTRCATCHDSRSWQSRFNADAHRRTNFPLTGRHALIACEECHIQERDRGFVRAAVECFACHRADYARTAAVSIDHAAAGFGTNCRECHSPSTFRGARFAAHDACFQLAPGPHAGIRCLDCHTTQPRGPVTSACSTNTASCTRCHACPPMQERHAKVSGFQCKDRKCYECHQFVAAPAFRPRPLPRGG